MKKSIIIASVLLLTLFLITIKAQEPLNKGKLDDYLHQLEKNNKAMCGVVIKKNGEIEYESYIGFSSIQNKIQNSHLTKFRIGSITKMFTTVMLFQLIEEGKLTLETKLSKFYPQIPNSKKITISELLSHRSGIHSFTDDKEYAQYVTSKKSKEEMLKLISDFKPDFQPDEKTAYSNSNFVLLGYIIEDVTNSTYPEVLKKRITDPLNLADTYYGQEINIQSNEAASYNFLKNQWDMQPETDMSIPHGAGAIVSTPDDLTTFITALFNHKLISENSLNQMKEIKEGYGKGLMRFPFGNKIAYGHNGGIDGFVGNLTYFPSENVSISVLANGMNTNFNEFLIGLLSIYFNRPFEIPDFTAKAIQLDTEELKKYSGEFSSELLPLKITLKVEDGILYGQATGQSAFPLTPFSKTEFRFEQAGIIIEFAEDDQGKIRYDSFVLIQSGGKYPYGKK